MEKKYVMIILFFLFLVWLFGMQLVAALIGRLYFLLLSCYIIFKIVKWSKPNKQTVIE